MAVKVKVSKVNGGMQAFKMIQKENIKNAKRAMGDAILGRATMIAPKLTGALHSDGRVETVDTAVQVTFGDGRVPYARRRHFENSKNPQTTNYLKKAGDSVAKEGIKNWMKGTR
jgi:hypothetical protein